MTNQQSSNKSTASSLKDAFNSVLDAALERNVTTKEDGTKVYPLKVEGGKFWGYDSLSDFVTVKFPPFGLLMALCSNVITYILFAATMREQWWPNADRFRLKGEWAAWFISVGLEPNPALIFIYLLITFWGESFTVKYIVRLSRYISASLKMAYNPALKADPDIIQAHLAAQYWLVRNVMWVIPAVVVTCLDLFASALDMTAGATTDLGFIAMLTVAVITVFSGEVFFHLQQDGREAAENGQNVMEVLRAKEVNLRVGGAQ